MIDPNAFSETTAPGTGRRALRLTDHPGHCYPLYYYVPSVTPDGHLVYHHAHDGTVQLHALDLSDGESWRLTDASAKDAQWRPWCTDPGEGVLDHRSALDPRNGHVVYFDGRDVRLTDVATGRGRSLFTLPEDRVAIGQNCVTPDGEWFVYIHHDRAGFERLFEGDEQRYRHRSEGTALAAYNLETGERRTILRINSPIHHVLPYDDEHLLFCHPATENGLLWTDLDGGWYSHLRTRGADGGEVCHFLATARGITYEVLVDGEGTVAGRYDPFTHERVEFDLPEPFGYTHTGYDPDGTLFFYETEGEDGHEIRYLDRHDPDGDDEWGRICGDWRTYGGGQKAHFHPRMTPDRDWLLVVAGDDAAEANAVYAVDVADLSHTHGLR